MSDLDDLLGTLTAVRELKTRKLLGDAGALKMVKRFGWESVAGRRLGDFEAALNFRGR